MTNSCRQESVEGAEHIPESSLNATSGTAAGLTFICRRCEVRAADRSLLAFCQLWARDAASPCAEGADHACRLFAEICRRRSHNLVAVLRRSSLLHHANSDSARSLLLAVVVQTGYRVAKSTRTDSNDDDRCSGNGGTDCDAEVPDPEMGRKAPQETTVDAPLLEPGEDGQTDRDLALVLAMR